MHKGLYEALVTRRLWKDVEASGLEPLLAALDPAEAPEILSRYLSQVVERCLAAYSGTSAEKLERQAALCARILALVDEEALKEPPQQLMALLSPNGAVDRPGIPLSSSALLVNARDEHRIGSELIRELASADRVDLLCSFLKWSGLRVLLDALSAFVRRGGLLRVLTTCYMAATEQRVLDTLCGLGNGVELKVSYDTRRTRLHAKAWLFYRDTGYTTAYIGSSNMSSAALLDGLEWNVRVSQVHAPQVLQKFEATFESYWNDGEFEPYDPEHFERALGEERGREERLVFALDVRPYPFQRAILENLEAERQVHGRWRTLVVSATGTGKTVVAALDYKRLREQGFDSLLFVAHRREILQQSMSTFRAVLRDGSFGAMWDGIDKPVRGPRVGVGATSTGRHLFASVQTLSHAGTIETLVPGDWDMVIIDEFHHAEAPTYRRLLEQLGFLGQEASGEPRVLLGLTATPERADGMNVADEFFGGRVAAELRLWDALERGLLSPFQYFGVHDNLDISHVPWTRGRYDVSALDKVYTGHHARVRLVLQALQDRVADVRRMRSLGFCVSVNHALFMAQEFSRLGLRSAAVTGATPQSERDQALADLRDRRINAIFTVDVFNEGVDVPEIDTVLMLRPTESATLFLQQLGRGLRLSEGKTCLTVLDFIGLARREFRFDVRYRALLGGTRAETMAHIEQGFPVLPSGCSIQLDRVAATIVLDNVRQSLRLNARHLVEELRTVGPGATLAVFLQRTGLELEDLYHRVHSWTDLRRQAFGGPTPTADEARLLKSIYRLLHVDDVERLRAYKRVLTSAPGERLQAMQRMVHVCLWGLKDDPTTLEESMERILACEGLRSELLSVLELLDERIRHLTRPWRSEYPLQVHARYTRDEVLAALGQLLPGRGYAFREGVFFHQATGNDVFFVTVKKAEGDYSPTTMYRDYALSADLFHWESQSTTRGDSPTGRRYQSHRLDGATQALLFVRGAQKDERGWTAPYEFLGPAGYVRHEGDRPMAVVWQLQYPVLAETLPQIRFVA
jgi:superfamily II DNA or RNA helicase